MKIRLSSIIILQGLFAFAVVPRANAQRDTSAPLDLAIDVQVRYPDGSPGPRDVHVRLENPQGGVDADCITVDGGKCHFQPREKGVYIVSVNSGGYMETSQRVELMISRRGYVTLTLRKTGNPAEGNSASDAPSGTTSVEALRNEDPSIPEKAKQEFAKGEAALRDNKPEDGVKHFQNALKTYEKYPQAYGMLGDAYLKLKDWKKAETALRRSLELDPKLVASYVDLGAVKNQEKDYPAAEEALKKGLELSPDAAPAKYELAKTYWAEGRWQDAAPYAEATVKAEPDLAGAHVLLGNILLRGRDPQGALKEYKEYLRLDPDGPMAAGVRDTIAKIQKALQGK
jgi:Tfp pilus assembly protein PilF